MSDQQVQVTFQPHGRTVYALKGAKVLEAAGLAALTIDTPCGGAGTCGKCRVQFTSGAPEPTDIEQQLLNKADLKAGWRLACQSAVLAECVVFVPESSRFADQHQILTETVGQATEVLPAVRKIYVELPHPTLADDTADLLRLEQYTGGYKTDLELLRELPGRLRRFGFKGTAVLTDHHLIDFEGGDTSGQCFGAAFDIGTTTIVGALLNLRNGEELAVASQMNPQVRFGDDVLSRIQYARNNERGGDELHAVIVEAVNKLFAELCSEANVPCEHIYEITFAGNTTMEHLLCAIDVSPLGEVPFVSAHARGLMLRADELGVSIHSRGAGYIFPVIGGFVGGDTVACILATQLVHQGEATLLVDIGTNGEIVLSHDGKLFAASTAAGPAFEGARITCGMRATSGAIEKVVFDDDMQTSVIGGTEAKGLCGSALVDAAAELLRCGVVRPNGRMVAPEKLPETLPQALRSRVRNNDANQPEFVLSRGSNGGTEVVLTQRDIRELQLATGAIRAGINILLSRAGLASGDLKSVLIAGGFGSFIRRSNAQRIGLLPGDIEHQKIQYVGNASLNGAKWALLSTNARKGAEELARKAEHVELSQDANFQDQFAEAMIFPSV